jgi:FkbM family methyltransferase
VSDPEAELARTRRRNRRNQRAAWARGFLQGITAMLKPGDMVIDLGANVGDVAAPLAATGAAVECFEPDPFAFARLEERFADAPNVRLVNAAAGTREGRVYLRRTADFDERPKGASVKSTILEGGRGISENAADMVEVRMVDFPTHLRTRLAEVREIALLKMDIEGAELDILEVMEREGLFHPIRCTLVETHERKFKPLRPRFRELKQRIGAAFPAEKVNLDWI